MARSDAPFGFRLARRQDNAKWSHNHYYVDSADTAALFIGDPVVLDGGPSAAIDTIAGSFPAGTLAGVTRQTAGSSGAFIGVVTGIVSTTRDSNVYRAASTAAVVEVCDDPNALYEVQADAAVEATDVGLNTNTVFTHSGSTVTGVSGAEVDADATADTAGALQWQIVSVLNRADNTVNAAGNIVVVRSNRHQRTGFGRVGV